MKISCFLSFVLAAVSVPWHAHAAEVRGEIESAGGSKIDVTAMLPTDGRAPRAVVLSIPGAAGIGDAELELQLFASVRNEPEVRPILPYALAARGYAYVYFNYGGIVSRKRCIDPALPSERVKKFFSKCLDRGLNRERGFSATDREVAAVRKWISKTTALQDVPVIILAFSEGAQHAARLIRSGKIDVAGLVGVGAPTVSPAENLRSQMTRKLRYRRINAFLDKHRSEALRVADLPKIFMDEKAVKYLQWSLRSQPEWTRAELAAVENFDVSLSAKAFDDWWKSNRGRPLAAYFFGTELEEFTAASFFQEQLDDGVNMAQSLTDFEGRSVFLFGEYDSQVDFSLQSACGSSRPPKCSLVIVPGAGHVFPAPGRRFVGLDPILQAIDTVNE